MNELLKKKCDLLIENRDVLKNAMKWEEGVMDLAGGSMFAVKDVCITKERIKECVELLKKNTGLFSEFRGHVKMPLVCKMAMSDDPEKFIAGVKQVYDMLVKGKIMDSAYRIMAAITIYENGGLEKAEEYVARTWEIYKKMKEQHLFLTSDEDIPFAAMLAVSGMDIDISAEEIERCFQQTSGDFRWPDARQTLSYILALDPGAVEYKCRRTAEIWHALKENGHKFSKGTEIAVLGALSSLDIPVDQLASEIAEADTYLKHQKGCGDLVLGHEKRRLFAAMLVLSCHTTEIAQAQDAMLTSTIMLIIQMEIMMMVIISSAVSSSISSSTSSAR